MNSSVFGKGLLDNTDSDSLFHVSDSESTEWWELSEGLDGHWLGWGHSDDTSITGFDGFWEFLSDSTGSFVHFVLDFSELASDMASMAIEDWRVTVHDLTWMVHDDNLSFEPLGVHSWLSLGVGGDVSSLDISDREILDVETNIVSWNSLGDRLVMHFDGFAISGDSHWSESDVHVWLDDTGLDSTDWDSSDTRDLVDILEWESEWFEDWSLWWLDGIESLKEVWSLVPWHVVGITDHVVTNPSGNWDEWNVIELVTNLFKIKTNLVFDLLVSGLLVVSTLGVHLVAADDHLLDSHGESEKSVFSGLSFLGPSGLEFSRWGSDHEDGDISLGGTGNHVLNEISMSWGINDGEDGGSRLEFPECDINGDTSLSLGLEFIKYPSVFERCFTHLFGFLLELGNSSLIDTTAFVDKMTGRGRFSRVDVTNDDE